MRFAAVLLAVACGGAEVSSAQETAASAVTDYLAANAIALKGVRAGIGFDDLKPLQEVFKDVRVVGLGEATHGTREFFQLKHRLLEFLVKEMGFDAFAIESSYVACLDIDDYVRYGRGDPAQALAGQKFWTWDTEEVAAMIEWMRQHNSQLPESQRVRFLGMDVGMHDRDVAAVIAGYLRKVSPDDLSEAQTALDPKNADSARLQALLDFFGRNRGLFVQRSSQEEFDRVLQHARILFQNRQLSKTGPDGQRLGSRDRYMAENVRDLMESLGPGTRMVVWAHNAHLSNRKSGSYELMGHFLRQWYGRAYYPLGFIFNEGSFQAMLQGEKGYALTQIELAAAPEGSVPWYFERARQSGGLRYESGVYLVDFRSAPATGPFAEWLMAPHPLASIGATFSHDWKPARYMREVVPGTEYDGMVFVARTTRARPTPTGMRPTPK